MATATSVATLKRTYPRTMNADGLSVELSRIGPGDRNDVVAFARALGEHDHLFLRMDLTDLKVVDDLIRDQSGDQRITLIARDGGKLVGYGSLIREPVLWTRHLGEIRVIVAQSHRAKGLGAALAREIFQIAKEVGLRKVIARMALRQEGARRMFERIGFHAEALLSDWVVDRNDRTHDLLVMSYDLTSLTAE
jgi:RimJ/RimL family protein N-acetyltransferase